MPTIDTIADLCTLFGIEADGDWFRRLNRSIYKNTECGASISVYGTESATPVVYHNGQGPIPSSFVLKGFTIQSIVEGSNAEVCSDIFPVGVYTGEQVDAWIEDMEAQVDDLWAAANGYDPDACGAEHDQEEV